MKNDSKVILNWAYYKYDVMMIVKTNQKDDRGNIIYHEIEMKSRSSMG